ncbi:myb domain-containing protein [Tieghemostelium lacteum]|uniref:Myb domain-containing protein n=1 Tax=Tieghemostelium lacteum TaxID=361077 RepID=A0A152A1X5_TIELA|nr:myb domain-containing protein [Tieghemostelium lacteum]|eukprot:KYR00071.1 myb domain-containing protein [Tieghemostelium lacteum]
MSDRNSTTTDTTSGNWGGGSSDNIDDNNNNNNNNTTTTTRNNNSKSNSNTKKDISDFQIIEDRYLTSEQKKIQLELGQKLISYSRAGLIQGVMKSIQDGANPDYKSCGYTALGYAAFNHHNDIIRWLKLEAKCQIDLPISPSETTPLGIAIQKCYPDTVALLLGLGASPLSKDKDGKTPFYHAIISGNLRIVKLLYSTKRIDLEEKDQDDNTVLHNSAASSIAVVEYLVNELKLSPLTKNKQGKTILHKAVICKNKTLVEYLAKTYPELINIQDNIGYTPLHYTVVYNLLDHCKILTKFGADVDLVDIKQNQTPFQLSNMRYFPDLTYHLLKFSKTASRSTFAIHGKVDKNNHSDTETKYLKADDNKKSKSTNSSPSSTPTGTPKSIGKKRKSLATPSKEDLEDIEKYGEIREKEYKGSNKAKRTPKKTKEKPTGGSSGSSSKKNPKKKPKTFMEAYRQDVSSDEDDIVIDHLNSLSKDSSGMDIDVNASTTTTTTTTTTTSSSKKNHKSQSSSKKKSNDQHVEENVNIEFGDDIDADEEDSDVKVKKTRGRPPRKITTIPIVINRPPPRIRKPIHIELDIDSTDSSTDSEMMNGNGIDHSDSDVSDFDNSGEKRVKKNAPIKKTTILASKENEKQSKKLGKNTPKKNNDNDSKIGGDSDDDEIEMITVNGSLNGDKSMDIDKIDGNSIPEKPKKPTKKTKALPKKSQPNTKKANLKNLNGTTSPTINGEDDSNNNSSPINEDASLENGKDTTPSTSPNPSGVSSPPTSIQSDSTPTTPSSGQYNNDNNDNDITANGVAEDKLSPEISQITSPKFKLSKIPSPPKNLLNAQKARKSPPVPILNK